MANAGSFKKGEKRPGQGRPKGQLNKDTALIRDMVAQALDTLGGPGYLVKVAKTHPGPFLALLGKVMPVQVEGAGGGPVQNVLRVEYVRPSPTPEVEPKS